MKKAFTLIELLGVIALLGILVAVAIPIIDSSIDKNREELYNAQINQIIKGAKDYYTKNLSELPNDGTEKVITINKLQIEGFLPMDIKNPRTGSNFPPTMKIVVKNENNTYKYTVRDET